MHFIPAIDVLDGRVVRLLRGSYDHVTVYADDAVAVATDHVAQGASLVHVVALGAARDGSDAGRTELAGGLAAADVPFQIGGGIRSAAIAGDVIGAGAHRVVVGTAAVADQASFADIVGAVGADRVVAAVDVRDGRARGSGWEDEGAPVGAVLDRVAGLGVGWALVTGISRDGTMEGPDLDLLASVRNGWPGLKIIASGGVGSINDLMALEEAGLDACVVGRALFENQFTVAEALSALSDA